MESRILGKLKIDEYDPDFFESNPFPIPFFNNKKILVRILEANYPSVLDKAEQSLQNFLDLNLADRIKLSPFVHHYYNETLKHGYTKPLNVIKPEDVWDFVRPSEIIIDSDETGNYYVNVSCGCAWEEEHGLLLVFRNGQTLISAAGHE